MNTEKINILLQAVKLGSFSKVAEIYSYTPSALSHIADSVENELGIKIVNRSFSGITLTEEGKLLLPYLEELINKSQDVLEIAKGLNKKQLKLTVGCYSSASKTILPEILINFKKAHPEITVSVVVGDSVKQMQEKNAEIFLISENEKADMQFSLICSDKYVAVVKEEYFLGRKFLCKEDFNEYPFLMSSNKVVEKNFGDINGEIVSVISDDDSSIISMVKNGLGVSVLPYLSVNKRIKGIKTLKLKPEIKRNLGIVYPQKIKNESAKKFIRFVSKIK